MKIVNWILHNFCVFSNDFEKVKLNKFFHKWIISFWILFLGFCKNIWRIFIEKYSKHLDQGCPNRWKRASWGTWPYEKFPKCRIVWVVKRLFETFISPQLDDMHHKYGHLSKKLAFQLTKIRQLNKITWILRIYRIKISNNGSSN